jgi:RNA polymerase sigma-70 factor, ECF subfamily
VSPATARRPEGDELSFVRAVYEAELPYVFRILRQLGAADRDIEDLAHEVFLVVHRRADDYDHSRPIRPWLFGISYRVLSKHRQKRSHRNELLGGPLEVAGDIETDAPLRRKEALQILDRALDAIEFERRAVFVMHEIDELTMPIIAETLGIGVNTAYSRLRLARDEFAGAVGRLRAQGVLR